MRDPNAIISTEALAASLDDPNVRVYDCTTYNNPPPPGIDEPYIPEPGLATCDPSYYKHQQNLNFQKVGLARRQRSRIPKSTAQHTLQSARSNTIRRITINALDQRKHLDQRRLKRFWINREGYLQYI